jgi:hypothetical protein
LANDGTNGSNGNGHHKRNTSGLKPWKKGEPSPNPAGRPRKNATPVKQKINPRSLANLKPVMWKAGQSGNPNGRPPGIRWISEHYRDVLQEEAPGHGGKTWGRVIAERQAKLAAEGAEKDADTIKAAVEMRRATEGDKVQVDASHTVHEWEVNDDNPEIEDPIPAAPWTNRLP